MDIIGRSCMLITSKSLTAKEPLAYRDLFFFGGPSYKKKNCKPNNEAFIKLRTKKLIITVTRQYREVTQILSISTFTNPDS